MGRNYAVTEDDGGTWSVTEVETDRPAVLDGVPQVGLTQEEAQIVAETLNAMTDDDDG